MVIFTCVSLLILAIVVFFIFGRKIKLLSYKISFLVLLILLIITGYFFTKVIYKANKQSLVISQQQTNNKYDNSIQEDNDLNLYKSKSIITVGSMANMSPWSYEKNNIVSGYNIDLIKEAVKLMGKKIDIVVYDNEKDLYSALEQKKIDIIADFGVIEKGNDKFTYSIKIVNHPFVFISNKKHFNKLIKNKENIKLPFESFFNKSIVVENISFFVSSIYDLLGKNIKLTILTNNDAVLSSMEQNKFDIGFVEYFSFLYYKNTHPSSNLITVSSLISIKDVEGFGFIVNSSDITLKQQLNIALNLLKRRGEMSKLSVKYFQEDVTL